MNHKRQFLKYVVPSIVSMLIFNLYTMVDGIYVGRYVGEHALAAVNISMPYINFIFAFSILFSIGTSIVVAIYKGEDKIKEANKTFTKNTLFLSVCGLSITFAVQFLLDDIAKFLGASDLTLPYVKDYLGILVWFSYFFIVSYSFEVLVKTDGFPRLATFAISIGALTNIVLDYVLIVIFQQGIQGAAFATGLSQVLTFLVFANHFLRHRGSICWCKTDFDMRIYKRILPIGSADCITELSAGILIFLFNRSIMKYIGVQGVVSFTIITYVYNCIMMTFTGISQGMQPLVSFYYGRKDMNLCQLYFQYAIRGVIIVSTVAIALCMFVPQGIVSIFIKDSSSALFDDSVKIFRLFSLCYLIMGYNIVCSGYFAAMESNRYSFLLSILRGWICIGVTLGIMGFLFQGLGIWLSPFVSELICLCISGCFLMLFNKQNKECY